MRLRLVLQADFRLNDQSLVIAALKAESVDLTTNDVVCFFSGRGNQVLFVWKPQEISLEKFGARKGTATVYRSERLRLSNSTWSPDMIQNYANQVGITLDGIKRFEEIHDLERKDAPKKRSTKSAGRHLKAV